MSISRRQIVDVALFVIGLALAAASAFAQGGHHLVVPADKVQFAPGPDVLPPGAQIAVLEGNPAEKGPITLRLRFPANYKIPAHWHSMAERVTVLSGSFFIGAGDKFDREATQELAPGGYVSLPAQMRHFAWAATPTVVQINLEGPFDIFYVNPADNPQKTQARR
jgi:quercetin dioxygenase-like cupin family protein